jgi:hypothetical protein
MTRRWVRAPSNADASTPTTSARRKGCSCLVRTSHATYAPTMPMAPWAKLRTPDPRYTTISPWEASE